MLKRDACKTSQDLVDENCLKRIIDEVLNDPEIQKANIIISYSLGATAVILNCHVDPHSLVSASCPATLINVPIEKSENSLAKISGTKENKEAYTDIAYADSIFSAHKARALLMVMHKYIALHGKEHAERVVCHVEIPGLPHKNNDLFNESFLEVYNKLYEFYPAFVFQAYSFITQNSPDIKDRLILSKEELALYQKQPVLYEDEIGTYPVPKNFGGDDYESIKCGRMYAQKRVHYNFLKKKLPSYAEGLKWESRPLIYDIGFAKKEFDKIYPQQSSEPAERKEEVASSVSFNWSEFKNLLSESLFYPDSIYINEFGLNIEHTIDHRNNKTIKDLISSILESKRKNPKTWIEISSDYPERLEDFKKYSDKLVVLEVFAHNFELFSEQGKEIHKQMKEASFACANTIRKKLLDESQTDSKSYDDLTLVLSDADVIINEITKSLGGHVNCAETPILGRLSLSFGDRPREIISVPDSPPKRSSSQGLLGDLFDLYAEGESSKLMTTIAQFQEFLSKNKIYSSIDRPSKAIMLWLDAIDKIASGEIPFSKTIEIMSSRAEKISKKVQSKIWSDSDVVMAAVIDATCDIVTSIYNLKEIPGNLANENIPKILEDMRQKESSCSILVEVKNYTDIITSGIKKLYEK